MPTASPDQLKAADPRNSVWVSANAGAGKTTVLTSRVVRLLLAGADPARILCVTFTKAAAANMQNRIFEALGKWVALDNDALGAAIAEMTGEMPRAGDLANARRLFARAVETPGGLKIQTIHGFCERLLHLFPFEAAVPARFKVLDDREQRAATEAAVNATLRDALKEPDSPLGRALRIATGEEGEDGFRDALRAFMAHRRDIDGLEKKFQLSPLRQRLGLKPGESVASAQRQILNQGFYAANWQDIHDWLATGSKTDRERAAALKAARRTQGNEDLDGYIQIFLTQDLAPRKTLATVGLVKADPELAQDMQDEQERVHELVQRIRAITAAERTEAITLIADAVNARYRAEKRRLGRLDFPDLIGKVVGLLTADTARWVLFKLDQGLDHVLVDEAQDTSPEQWHIVKALSDDFFAGEGARAIRRTIFAVGDEKQSIFGFQGAKPEEFDKARQHFRQRIAAHNSEAAQPHPFEEVKLRQSYRTVADVLTLVDQVFSIEEHYRGLESESKPTVHVSQRVGKPGLVELWEPELTESTPDKDAFEPVDSLPEDASPLRLARRVARRIRFWLDHETRFEDDGLPITPGDVLILVRNRGPLFTGVIRELKLAGVPVAGADRMRLNEQIAVLDLLALGRFCLLPEDDLTLAALLKSPLIGLDEEQLLTLAHGHGNASLWQALQARAGEPAFALAAGRLARWRQQARRLDPFAFYMGVLSADHGRRDLLARLGVDADEAINVFLATLRQWQAAHPPSLLGFLEAMAADESDVKRDMEEAHGRVRVMTVHASKGLEARIVFLIDTAHNPKGGGNSGPKLIEIDEGVAATAVWVKGKKSDPPALEPARESLSERTLAESRRLLYVALTRARDRLYIGSAYGKKTAPQGFWRGMIDAAVAGQATLVELQAEDGDRRVTQWRSVQAAAALPKTVPAAEPPPDLPEWLKEPAGNDQPRPPPLRPSRLADAAEPPPMRDGTSAAADARLRGDLIHHLLQHLPGLPPAVRPATAARLAAARFPALDGTVRAEAISAALALMAEPRFALLFSGSARAEVDIAGAVTIGDRKLEVAGRIDRLVISKDQIILVDYKTGRPPRDPSKVPDHHLKQLAVYEALLRDLYPERAIVTAVVWTALPEIVVIPPQTLAASLESIDVESITLESITPA
jgi:ATP-dependent helicase/nuclease subunit A